MVASAVGDSVGNWLGVLVGWFDCAVDVCVALFVGLGFAVML